MLTEITSCTNESALLAWAESSLPKKNTLSEVDAQFVETSYWNQLQKIGDLAEVEAKPVQPGHTTAGKEGERDLAAFAQSPNPTAGSIPIAKEVRKRSKAHLLFVRAQACLVCKQSPCDAHHLKFAQQRALGRKVSDEFTVPLCRAHHQQLHRHGNEKAWWANLQISPLETAKELWDASQLETMDKIHLTA